MSSVGGVKGRTNTGYTQRQGDYRNVKLTRRKHINRTVASKVCTWRAEKKRVQ